MVQLGSLSEPPARVEMYDAGALGRIGDETEPGRSCRRGLRAVAVPPGRRAAQDNVPKTVYTPALAKLDAMVRSIEVR